MKRRNIDWNRRTSNAVRRHKLIRGTLNENLRNLYKYHGYCQAKMARDLNTHRQTIYKKLKKEGIEIPKTGEVKRKFLKILDKVDTMTPKEIRKYLGCSQQYARDLRREFKVKTLCPVKNIPVIRCAPNPNLSDEVFKECSEKAMKRHGLPTGTIKENLEKLYIYNEYCWKDLSDDVFISEVTLKKKFKEIGIKIVKNPDIWKKNRRCEMRFLEIIDKTETMTPKEIDEYIGGSKGNGYRLRKKYNKKALCPTDLIPKIKCLNGAKNRGQLYIGDESEFY